MIWIYYDTPKGILLAQIFIDFHDKRWEKYDIDFSYIADAVLTELKITINPEISLVLTNDTEIQKLNREYRGLDKSTNVLSFETGDPELLGDIFISYDTTMRESGKSEFINHTTHLIIHGILHLLGYDHIDDKDADKMEALEIKILKKLKIKNPYKSRITPSVIIVPIALGAVASLGFAPFHLWFLTIIAFCAMYFITIKSEKIILPAALFGASYAITNFWWVLNSIFVVPELASQFAIFTIPGLIGIGLVGAAIFSLPFILLKPLTPGTNASGARRPFIFAVLCATLFYLREWLFTGFPWNPVANIFINSGAIANSMSAIGAIGLSFIIMGLTAGIAEFINNKKVKFPLVAFSVLLIIGAWFGYKNMERIRILPDLPQTIRIVQPAYSQLQKATHSRQDMIKNAQKNIDTLVAIARHNTGVKPDIIVFPETAYPFIIDHNTKNINTLKKIKKPIIMGANTYQNWGHFNSMIMINKTGRVEKIYSKSHLVPFGEYRPFGDIIPTPGQLTKGNGAEIINFSGLNFAPAICYEIIFSDSLVPRNAMPNMIINITNDTWFGATPGTYQHLDMARTQAIEMGLPVVRANYSGISAFINADGTIRTSLPVGVAGVLDARVGGTIFTPYRQLGLHKTFILILLFSIVMIFITRKKA
ncbi:MAG: apolipoprotein N-acyltransferase [Rickettsiales bacterium]|jgi:apolipoprotein N-acyltransferase|nr:apolipoprotein N-acyltransferase [Rickettsiales bacterium]